MSDCPCDTPPVLRLEIAAGLDALPRQLRAFPEVRRALLAALPTEPALQDWRARNSRDLGLMLLEMWAYVSDVLGFYDERIANESYIRTAQRRTSLRRLVELIGYVPAPGIAGSITLAAIAEGRIDVTLPVGTGFRSDAFAGQAPQVFEITEETVISTFKNQWTTGPVPATVPQPTPTELANGGVQAPGDRTFFIFETAAFALAEDQIAVITVDGFDPQVARVKKFHSFGAKDGKTYNEVEFDQPVGIPDGTSPLSVHTQKPTAVINPTFSPENDGSDPPPVDSESVDGTTFKMTVNLESQTSQLKPRDPVIIRDTSSGSEVFAFAVVDSVAITSVTVGSMQVPVSNLTGSPAQLVTTLTTVPLLQSVTKITLITNTDFKNRLELLDSTQFSFSFNFINGGTLTAVADIDLDRGDIEGKALAVTGIVQPPPDAQADPSIPGNLNLPGDFLLSDSDKHGAGVTGTMVFDSSGHARLLAKSDSLNPPEQTFRTPVTVLGNILFATRGETVNNEVLGSGDPRVGGQTFKLKKKPLTYLLTGGIDRVSTLHVFVDNVEWHEVRSFLNCGPQSRAFTVRHDDDQQTFITFGDGVHGARLPSGVSNIVATYRFGSGKAAPPAGAVTQIARPVIGLRAVRSPVAATEGRDPEGPDELRSAGPKSALLFDRAVSARDFEIVAGQQAGVIKVIARFAWIPDLGAAGVVVRFIGTPKASDIQSTLAKRAELNLLIDVHKAEAAASTLHLVIEIDPDFQPDPVVAAVKAALLDEKTGPLAPVNATIGKGQFLASPIFETVQAVPGVVAIRNASLDSAGHDTVDFGQSAIACIDVEDQYFSFDPETGVDITHVDPTGAVTATPIGGC